MGAAHDNDALVRELLDAWIARDVDRVLACWADDGVYHAMPLDPIVGKAAFAAFARSFATVPPPRIEVHHQVASEHAVINERTDHLDFHGRDITLPICAVFEVRDGRVTAWREYFDPARFR